MRHARARSRGDVHAAVLRGNTANRDSRACARAEKRLKMAAMREMRLDDAVKQAEQQRTDLERKVAAVALFNSRRAAAVRAKACAARLLELRPRAPQTVEPPVEVRPPTPPPVDVEPVEDVPVDEADLIMKMDMDELVPRLVSTVGPQESWKTDYREEDARLAGCVCDRMYELLDCGKEAQEKKTRKLALELRLFDEIGPCMRKFEAAPVVLAKAMKVLEALSRGANAKVQKLVTMELFNALVPSMVRQRRGRSHSPAPARPHELRAVVSVVRSSHAAPCLHCPLHAQRRLQDPCVATVKALTKNCKETTKMALRMGWSVDDLAEDSNVRIDERGRVVE